MFNDSKLHAMNIKTYITQNKIPIKVVAKKLDRSRQWIHKLIAGTPASPKLAQKIVEWSEGEITLEEALCLRSTEEH